MARRQFSTEQQTIIRNNYLKLSGKSIAKMLNCSPTMVQRYLTLNNLVAPPEVIRRFRSEAMSGKTKLTPKQDRYLKKKYLILSPQRLADKFGVSETCVKKRMEQLTLVIPVEIIDKRVRESRIQPGNIPRNKGKKTPEHVYFRCKATMFKKGQIPHNARKSKNGDISIRYTKGRPYVHLRLAKGDWLPLHVYVWELINRKAPFGYVIWFKDGETLNCCLDNLTLMSRAENMKNNSSSVHLKDGFIAQSLSRLKGGMGLFDRELYDELMNNKPLLELKRKQLQLKRAINEQQRL
jgi:biotin operon repressor